MADSMKKLVEEISRTTNAELGRLSRKSSALGVDVKSESPDSGNNKGEITQNSTQESDVAVTTDQQKWSGNNKTNPWVFSSLT